MKDPVEDVPNEEVDFLVFDAQQDDFIRRNQLLTEAKTEIGHLRQLSESIDRVTPLIYDDIHVVKHI